MTAGSRGAGLTLSDAVTVSVEAGSGVVLNDDTATVEAVERVLDALDVGAAVEIETPLPVGAGFGVSGAAALGTALAAAAAFDRRLTADELVAIAHGADVQAGTGLGDVVAQARGGVPIRLDPGAPTHGRVDAIPARGRVEYVTFGDRSTADVLAGDTTDLSAAGRRALAATMDEPHLAGLMRAGRRFAREADLLTPRVREAITAVGEAGGEASMAMLGETVFALGEGLSDAGYDPVSCEISPVGATLAPPDT